jgi:hypothetical protein
VLALAIASGVSCANPRPPRKTRAVSPRNPAGDSGGRPVLDWADRFNPTYHSISLIDSGIRYRIAISEGMGKQPPIGGPFTAQVRVRRLATSIWSRMPRTTSGEPISWHDIGLRYALGGVGGRCS